MSQKSVILFGRRLYVQHYRSLIFYWYLDWSFNDYENMNMAAVVVISWISSILWPKSMNSEKQK